MNMSNSEKKANKDALAEEKVTAAWKNKIWSNSIPNFNASFLEDYFR